MPPDLSVCETEELEDRVRHLLGDLDEKLKEAGPLLERIGRARDEIRIITDELERRGGGLEA